MFRLSYSRLPLKFVFPTNSAFLSRSTGPTTVGPTGGSPQISLSVPAPGVPPYRKRSIRISYEIFDQGYTHGRRKEPKFIFTAAYDISDDRTKTEHKDDFCRKCNTTYYKRYAIALPTEDGKMSKSVDAKHLKYIEAHGEIRRMCPNCRRYFHVLLDDVKSTVGNGSKETKS